MNYFFLKKGVRLQCPEEEGRRRGNGGMHMRGGCGVDGVDPRAAGHATCPNMSCPEYCRISPSVKR